MNAFRKLFGFTYLDIYTISVETLGEAMYPITIKSYWGLWHLKSLASRLFAQPFVQVPIKENIKALHHWPLLGKFTGHQRIPLTRGQVAENLSIWWRHHVADCGGCTHEHQASWLAAIWHNVTNPRQGFSARNLYIDMLFWESLYFLQKIYALNSLSLCVGWFSRCDMSIWICGFLLMSWFEVNLDDTFICCVVISVVYHIVLRLLTCGWNYTLYTSIWALLIQYFECEYLFFNISTCKIPPGRCSFQGLFSINVLDWVLSFFVFFYYLKEKNYELLKDIVVVMWADTGLDVLWCEIFSYLSGKIK